MKRGLNTIFNYQKHLWVWGVQGPERGGKRRASLSSCIILFVLHRAWQNSLFLDHNLVFILGFGGGIFYYYYLMYAFSCFFLQASHSCSLLHTSLTRDFCPGTHLEFFFFVGLISSRVRKGVSFSTVHIYIQSIEPEMG